MQTISFGQLTANAPDVFRSLAESGEPIAVELDGEHKVVLEDFEQYEFRRRGRVLARILDERWEEGHKNNSWQTPEEVFGRIRQRLAAMEEKAES